MFDDQVQALVSKHFPNAKRRGDEYLTDCPFCHGGPSHRKDCFSINAEKGTYVCNRKNNCGKAGTVKSLRIHLEGGDVYRPREKTYAKPTSKIVKPSDELFAWFKGRGISPDTLRCYRVSLREKNMMSFPYFDLDGQLTYMKHRTFPDKKFFADGGCKPILFGMQFCDHGKPLVITEGEIDALSVAEVGYSNVVSLPLGAADGKGDHKLDCLAHCWDWLQKFPGFVIWGDKDDAGEISVQKLIDRLGKGRCRIVVAPEKDANDTLVRHGAETVREAIANAAYLDAPDVIRLSTVRSISLEHRRSGTYGISRLDKVLGGFRMGEVTVWSGFNSSGKSTLVNQFVLQTIAEGFRACIYSGELPDAQLAEWMNLQAAGKDYVYPVVAKSGAVFYRVDPVVLDLVRNWYDYSLYLYRPERGASVGDEILDRFGYVADRFGVEVFVIDNLMKCTIGATERDIYNKQTEFVSRAVDFAQDRNVHVHLIAHPRKTDGGKRMTKADVAGSFNITNLADNVIGLHRFSDAEKATESFGKALIEAGAQNADAMLEIFKNRYMGRQDVSVLLRYEESSRRFYPAQDKYFYDPPWKRMIEPPPVIENVYMEEF